MSLSILSKSFFLNQLSPWKRICLTLSSRTKWIWSSGECSTLMWIYSADLWSCFWTRTFAPSAFHPGCDPLTTAPPPRCGASFWSSSRPNWLPSSTTAYFLLWNRNGTSLLLSEKCFPLFQDSSSCGSNILFVMTPPWAPLLSISPTLGETFILSCDY